MGLLATEPLTLFDVGKVWRMERNSQPKYCYNDLRPADHTYRTKQIRLSDRPAVNQLYCGVSTQFGLCQVGRGVFRNGQRGCKVEVLSTYSGDLSIREGCFDLAIALADE
ncbi:hypothetical protein PoB_000078000 [Plakobranchus ocellatus]|uniref:Uncharacterized protein n=1 Tax=Plakobranchus ocellatus TaxID=259542 RepID=A0AAV3XV56_9GAST|nr:hypothetical protein PoB_000078000 [Plakobranchus ocellatus]